MGKSPRAHFAGLCICYGMRFHSTPTRRGCPTTRWLLLAVAVLFASPLSAQISSKPVAPPVQLDSKKLTVEELSQLLAPIALYPDALIGLILPASTVPSDIVLAARYLKAGGSPTTVESQAWDDSVKALARYPEVLAWLDENLEWTSSVGEAFVEQPTEVMVAIQMLRKQAKAAGNLADTPQQNVIAEEDVIRIIPADPEVIYVPQYDPQVVYIQSYTTVPVLTFGPGFAVGSWLCYDFDWRRRCFYRGNWNGWTHDRNRNWNGDRDGNRSGVNVLNIDTNNANQWRPSASAQRQMSQRQSNNNGNARYVSTRPSGATLSAAGQNSAPQNTVYNPASNPALPRPGRLESTVRGTPRERTPDRTAAPAAPVQATTPPAAAQERSGRTDTPRMQTPAGQPSAPPRTAGVTEDANPGSPPDRPNRTRPTPSAAPEAQGQSGIPAQPAQPDRFTTETPTAIREGDPSFNRPPSTPRQNRETVPNPARNSSRQSPLTPAAPAPQVPGQIPGPAQPRTGEPVRPQPPYRNTPPQAAQPSAPLTTPQPAAPAIQQPQPLRPQVQLPAARFPQTTTPQQQIRPQIPSQQIPVAPPAAGRDGRRRD